MCSLWGKGLRCGYGYKVLKWNRKKWYFRWKGTELWQKSDSLTNIFGVSKNDGESSKAENLDSDTKVIKVCGKPIVK